MRYFPREIVIGWHMNFKNHFKVVIGSDVEAHNVLKVKTNMNPITY